MTLLFINLFYGGSINETPLEDVQTLPRPVLEHYVALFMILCCKYDDEALRKKEIRKEVRALSRLGWKAIIKDDYFDIVRKDMLN